MPSKDTKLYSFDIFDTLFTRRVATPTGIFVILQHILNKDASYQDIPDEVKINFYQYRIDAEFHLRRINKTGYDGIDIKLDSIYSYIEKKCHLSPEQASRIKELEVRLEIESVVPIDENIVKVKELLAAGKRVVLISDMYLPKAIVEKMLCKADPVLTEIKLYLSSELGYMKATLELYKYVKDQENVEYKEWIHYGDNRNIDELRARELGIDAKQYKYVALENYEKRLLGKFLDPVTQLTVGCTKNLRLNTFPNNDKASIGASFAGPALWPYVHWVLKQCKERSIKRLYFIARDGYILKKIADTLIAQEHEQNIETSYIYGSRKTWRVFALDINEEALHNQLVYSFKYEFKNIHSTLGFDKEEMVKLLPEGLKEYWKKKNSEKIYNYFMKDKSIVLKAYENGKQQVENTIKYLKNNIDYSDEDFAFVDLDGSGLTLNCLASAFKRIYPKPIKAFYFASTPMCYEPLNVEQYCFMALKTPWMGNLVELMTRAPHGQALKYDDDGNPVLEKIDEAAFYEWGYEDYMKGVLAFVTSISEYSNKYNFVSFDSQEITNFYLNYLFHTPDKKTADILGTVRHTLFGAENKEFAPKLNVFEALMYVIPSKTKTESIRLSKARSGRLAKKILQFRIAPPQIVRKTYSYVKRYI